MSKSPAQTRPAEERRAEAATIGWMLATLCTAAGLLCALGTYLLVRPMDKPPEALVMLPGLLLLMSAGSGVVDLVLTPVVLRLRKTLPPPAVTRTAVLVGVAPMLLLVVIQFL